MAAPAASTQGQTGTPAPGFDWHGHARLATARDVAEGFSRWARGVGITDRWRDRALLVLDELVSNVARHAYPAGMAKPLRVSARLCGDCIRVVVADQAPAFDPCAAASQPSPETLSGERLGGLGLVIVHHTASRLAYRRLGDGSGGGNEVTFWIDKPQST